MWWEAPGSRLHPRVLVLVLALRLLLRLVLLQGDLEGLPVLTGLAWPHVQHHRLTLDEAAQAALQALLQRLGARVGGAGLDFVLLLEVETVSLAKHELFLCLTAYHHPLFLAVCKLPVVRFEHVMTFLKSTPS